MATGKRSSHSFGRRRRGFRQSGAELGLGPEDRAYVREVIASAKELATHGGIRLGIRPLLDLAEEFADYPPVFRAMLDMVVEHEDNPQDVIHVVGKLRAQGDLRPEDELREALAFMEEGRHSEALPGLLEGLGLPPMAWKACGVTIDELVRRILICRSKLDLRLMSQEVTAAIEAARERAARAAGMGKAARAAAAAGAGKAAGRVGKAGKAGKAAEAGKVGKAVGAGMTAGKASGKNVGKGKVGAGGAEPLAGAVGGAVGGAASGAVSGAVSGARGGAGARAEAGEAADDPGVGDAGVAQDDLEVIEVVEVGEVDALVGGLAGATGGAWETAAGSAGKAAAGSAGKAAAGSAGKGAAGSAGKGATGGAWETAAGSAGKGATGGVGKGAAGGVGKGATGGAWETAAGSAGKGAAGSAGKGAARSAGKGAEGGAAEGAGKGLSLGLTHWLLALRASELFREGRFEQLLCLPGLRGVDEFEYQIETVRKVLQRFRGRVLLADEVGLGKTIEAGMVLREYWLRGMARKILILTPPALVSQWCEELSTKFDLAPLAAEGAELRRDPEAFWQRSDLVVASLALARNQRHQPILASIGYDMVVVDEAHHLKNRSTAGWKLVNALRSRFLLLLTATPVENDLMDLYSLVTLLKPGQLGTQAAFKRSFVLKGDPTRPRNRDSLRELIGEVMIRNTRAVADVRLPPRHATTVLVEGEPAERELYGRLTELVRRCYREGGDGVGRLSLGLLLQEAGSSPSAVGRTLEKMAAKSEGLPGDLREEMRLLSRLASYVPEPAKVARLLELLRRSGEKTLVFSRFIATLEELSGRLVEAGIPHSLFTGRHTRQEKDEAVARLRDGVDVMLCTEVGGEGRNLQFCSTLVNYDLPWNPMKIEQRIGRIHRIGQERPVYIYNLCAKGTAENHILDVLDGKINLFELVVGELDLVLGQRKDEAEFEERILAIYGESRDEDEVARAFERLGDELLDARRRYDKIKELDSAIFSDDYEA